MTPYKSAKRIMPIKVIVVASIAIMAVGCGRKASLDTPYEAALQARKDAEKAKQPLPPEPTPPVQDKPFILDPLLKG